jgi:hypothetical protein
MNPRLRLACIVALATLTACGARPPLEERDAAPSASTASGTGGAGGLPIAGAGGTGAAGNPSQPMPPATPTSAPRVCGATTCETAFAPEDLGTNADVAATLVGRWQFCSGGEEWRTWAPPDTVGVEFTSPNGPALESPATPSGDVYFLVAGPDGAPVRGTSADYHLRYDVLGQAQVDMMRADGGFFWGNARYSTCPRQLELHLMYKTIATLHVPILDGDRPVPPPAPACTSTTAASPAMQPQDFCAVFLADCGTSVPGFTTLTECETTYASGGSNRRACESYHVCNANVGTAAAREIHCPHASGQGPCMLSN